MRTLKRLQKRCAPSSGHFVLNRFCYEATPVPLELINFVEEIRGQCDRDSLVSGHDFSMP